MSKKVKVLVSILMALVLLTAGGAATVMAQEEESTPTPEPTTKIFMGTANTTGLLVRVAEILGIPQEDLSNAFKQAQQEMREEASLRALDKAVEKGLITQEEADQIKEWWQQRPGVLDASSSQRFFGAPALRGRHMLGGRHMWGGHRGWCPDDTTQAD